MFQLPRQCRTFTAIKPISQWGWNEIFTNKMVYLLETLVWMKTKDARKKFPQNKPKPFVPDFMQSAFNEDIESHTTDEIDAILNRPRLPTVQ